VRHAASAAADRDRGGNVLSAFAAAGQGRHEVLPHPELVMNGELSAVSSALRCDRLLVLDSRGARAAVDSVRRLIRRVIRCEPEAARTRRSRERSEGSGEDGDQPVISAETSGCFTATRSVCQRSDSTRNRAIVPYVRGAACRMAR